MTGFCNSSKELPVNLSRLILLQMEICLVMHGENKKIKNHVVLIFDIFSHVFRHRISFEKQHDFPIQLFT